jgi:16S rRNA (cytosine967-C5)-methyltransferase
MRSPPLPSSTKSTSAATTSPRIVRVRKAASAEAASPNLPAGALAPDSLGRSLVLAAHVLAAVHAGRSLTEALALLASEPPGARAAAQDVAYGVLRRFGWGEYILGRLLSKPLSHPETQALLLAALYRLETRADSPHMVVDQAVSAAGELAGGVFKGLVNGVLRNYLRQRDTLLAGLAADETAHYQHPRWWLNRLRRSYPEQWEAIVQAGNSQPPMSLRVNLRQATRAQYVSALEAAGLAARPSGQAGLILERAQPVDALPGFFEGFVSVQDVGAQRAAELLAPASGAYVLDACAAPGGKTAHLLEAADIELLALDIDATRTRRIEDNVQRLQLAATVRVADCSDVRAWWDGRAFDAILADVPCSGSGVVRRHPDIKSLRRESDIRSFAKTQASILDALWPLLKPGGTFLYATCSVFVEENSAQIDSFAVRNADVERLGDEQWLPGTENDGFYYALLRKAV